MPITLRPAEQFDIPAMAAIRARERETESYWTSRISLYLSGEQSPQQGLPSRAVFVALDGTERVGFVAGHRTHRLGCGGELQWINVIEERRGQGVADRLLAKIGAWFVAHKAYHVCVNIEPTSTAARKLYKRWGATPLNDYWMIWEDSRAMCTPRGE